MLRSAVGRTILGVQVVFANDARAVEAEFESADLLLVNRVLDGEFESTGGVELVRSLAARAKATDQRVPALMLVSNFADAQEEAVAAGARPGFGKKEMNSERVRELIRAALGVPVTG